jgi:long-chain fatty acid transport protein
MSKMRLTSRTPPAWLAGRLWLPALLFAAGLAQAQQDAAFSAFQLNRSLPGARSLAMGGSFVAVADDASAAYANPAGLTLLTRREVSVEGRNWRNDFQSTDRGRIDGQPSGLGIDTNAGIVRQSGHSDASRVSFASYVEAAPERRWSAALYYRTYASFDAQFDSQGVFSADPTIPRFGPYRFASSLDVASFGASYAMEFGNCGESRSRCLHVGATLSDYSLQLASVEDVLRDPANQGAADFNAPLVARERRAAAGNVPAVNVGFLYEPGTTTRIGLAYRQGPSFTIQEDIFNQRSTGRIGLPAEYSAGFCWHNLRDLLFSAEVDRIAYSSLIAGNTLRALSLKDGTELRLGGEWAAHQNAIGDKLLVMAGAWYDPDHELTFKGPITSSIDLFRRAYFPAGTGQVHASAGLGLRWGSFQTNAGADVSRQTRTLSLSETYRLPR